MQALKVGLFVPHDERPPFHQWLDRTGIKVVVRPPSTEGLPARRTVLYEYEPLSDPETPYIVVDEAHGFYIVTEEESVCFVYEHIMQSMCTSTYHPGLLVYPSRSCRRWRHSLATPTHHYP